MKISAIHPYRHTHFFAACMTILFLLNGCKSSEPKPEAGAGDLTGFELTAIPNSSTQHAIRKDANGQIAIEGYVTDNKRSGQWIEFSPEGDITLIENYVNGLREGWSFKMITRGQIDQKARYHLGSLNGPWIQYKFGKIIEERTYTMGNLDGTVKTYDDRTWKLKQEVQYKDGKQHGYFRYYDEEGNVTLEYEYKNGEKVSGGIVEKK